MCVCVFSEAAEDKVRGHKMCRSASICSDKWQLNVDNVDVDVYAPAGQRQPR